MPDNPPEDRAGRWRPEVGEETSELHRQSALPAEDLAIVRDEAATILSQCVPPADAAGQETGLVVGYIQSGKTLSFTTVAALARDNGYPVVIVISGTSIPLTDQSQRRLRADLRLEQREDRSWRHLHNPRLDSQDDVRIRSILEDWRDPDAPDYERCTVLITVMKHHGHLNHLRRVLERVDLRQIPVLIVDDEGDQAGLNNLINQGEESTTYRRLRRLKDVLPHHTFLQYTATPQGPLLINLIDVLSPDFAKTLTPGPDYTGGRDFFLADDRSLFRVIPPADIPTRARPLPGPPESLLAALRIFFLGTASGRVRDQGRDNRSMMVHPSHRTAPHSDYFVWVRSTCDSWMQLLRSPGDPDVQDLRRDFRQAYDDLRETVPDLEPFDDLMSRMARVIRRTEIHLVNAVQGRTPQIDWRSAYSHILVGGQALDRGFTVEGLTVTYMPRGVGARRADTIQQRARFFGYKRRYLGYCRVFLEQDVAAAFRRYVEHEENIRARLLEFEGRPLDELRRAFLLPPGLRATRESIIDVDYVTMTVTRGWFYPRAPHDSAEYVEQNRAAIRGFLDRLDLVEDEGHPDRTVIQRHLVAAEVSLREVFEDLLTRVRFSSLTDAQNLLAMIVVIRQQLADNPDAGCTVYQMSGGEARQRTLSDDGEIRNLFQGAAPVNPPERRGEIYPGDREIRGDGVTIQVHNLKLVEPGGAAEYDDISNIAVWIPPAAAGNVLIQDQGGEVDVEGE